MRLPRSILHQLARPHGAAANLVARLLNRGNRRHNRMATDALDLRPGARVLDVGFGGGVSFPHLLERVAPGGRVAGLETSGEMVRRAERRWAEDVQAGRMEVREGSVEEMPWSDGAFDGVLSVNTVYFWPDPVAGLQEVRRVLAPGGRVVLGTRPEVLLERAGFRHERYRVPTLRDVESWLREAGFDAVSSRTVGAGATAMRVTVGDRAAD